MIASMTAFGRGAANGDWGCATCEIKTVNHRYLEVTIRLPEELRQLENSMRKLITARLGRGKVDCTLRFDTEESSDHDLPLDLALTAKLIDAVDRLPVKNFQPINPLDILRWPGVIRKNPFDADTLAEPLLKLLNETLDALVAVRQGEGIQIAGLILERCEQARRLTSQLRAHLPAMIEYQRNRIMTKAAELSLSLDPERLEQEMLLLITKMDVVEELDRLESHLGEVKRLLNQDAQAGRRLDFLMQELNREANTLGSKACNIEVTNSSVELKVLIEQMREQIQNIE